MHNVYNKNFQSIGNTPLVKLSYFSSDSNNNIFGKIEARNPAFSLKDRVAYSMITDALKEGKLKEGMEIIEPTSGNTGIALAMIGTGFSFIVNIVMPESMSEERKKIIQAFGAKLILTEASKGMRGAIEKTKELMSTNPEKYFMPDQFSNQSNPKIHMATTGPEIYRDLSGNVDVFVAGVGTGGTITGVSRFFKKNCGKQIISIAIEPERNPAITCKLENKPFSPSTHLIQGIGAGFIPENLDLTLIDRAVTVGDEEALEYAKLLIKEEGIFAGISSGAAIAGAIKFIKKEKCENKNIVIVLPDTAERYLTTKLF